MPLTQANRSLKIATPLGQDVLLLESFTGTEQISRLFQFELVLVSENENIKPSDLLGQNVTVSVLHSDEQTERYFNGFISRFTQLPSEHRLARYHAEMVPWFWFLTQTANCSIFQEKTVIEIVEKVFETFGFSDYEIAGIGGGHERWEYCVWYRETAFNFCSRLLEQEGIFFFFRHENGRHTLVLADQRSAHKPCDDPNSKVPMAPSEGPGAFLAEEAVHNWEHQYEFRPGKWAQTDYNFKTPGTSLLTSTNSLISVGGNQSFEVYDYPGEYLNRVRDAGRSRLVGKAHPAEDQTPQNRDESHRKVMQ